MQGCQLPLLSCCYKTAPKANKEASISKTKGFDESGISNTGNSVKHCFKVLKVSCHSGVHSNFSSFLSRSFRGQVRFSYLCINC